MDQRKTIAPESSKEQRWTRKQVEKERQKKIKQAAETADEFIRRQKEKKSSGNPDIDLERIAQGDFEKLSES